MQSVFELANSVKFFKTGDKVRGFLKIDRTVSVFECESSVAYAYYKVLLEREYRKKLWYLSRSSDDHLIWGSLCWRRDDMKKMGSEKKEGAPVAPQRTNTAKDEPPAPPKAPDDEDKEAQKPKQHPQIHLPNMKKLKGNCKQYCAVISYVILGILAILMSIGVIIVTSLASVATKIYDTEQSSRLVAMVVLAVTAAVTLSMVIYAIVGAFRKNPKPLHATGIVLIIVAIIQVLIIGVAVRVTARDELNIGKSLSESFKMAKEDHPRHAKLWSATQYDLQCCGVYGPEDYRDPTMPYYFPPNVPIPCCPTYDASKPPYNQERQRELCKVNATYYENGCRGLVIEVFKETSVVVIGINVVLIVVEVLLTILGAYLNKYKTQKQEHDGEDDHDKPKPVDK